MDIFSTLMMYDGPQLLIGDLFNNTAFSLTFHPENIAPYLEGTIVMLKCVPHQKAI